MATVFRLIRFNPIRASRKVGAAEVEVSSSAPGEYQAILLWMTAKDIKKNLAEAEEGDDLTGLYQARDAYKNGVAVP